MSQDSVPVPSPAAGEAERVHAEPETAAARVVAPPSLVEQAALYATRGFRVVINHGLDPNGNCTCGNYTGKCPSPSGKSSAGKHPRHSIWLENAITTEAGARAEWLQRPNSNIGLVPPDGVIVLDIDPRNGGDTTWDSLVEECGPLDGPTALTGGGGLHVWIRKPEGLLATEAVRRIKDALRRRGPGIDLRDASAQVIVSPSKHASGRRYAWMLGRSVLECDPVVPSEKWLCALGLATEQPELTTPPASRAVQPRSHDDDLDRARFGLLESGLLDAGMDYDDWFRVVAALKSLGHEGKEIAEAWSKTSSKYVDGDVERRWAGIAGSSPGTLFWLFDHASTSWRSDYRRSRCVQGTSTNTTTSKASHGAEPPAVAPGTRQLRKRSYEEVLEEPPVEFLLEGYLQKDGVNLIAGEPSVGKSLFAQDLIQRVIRGSTMFGLRVIPGSVNYFYAEGRLGPRLRAWEAGNPAAESRKHPVNFVELPEMTDAAGVAAMRTYLVADCAHLNVVDTLALAASGADENAASGAASMGQVLREIGRLRDDFGGTWVIIHHLTKDKSRAALDRIRGSGAIRANCDSILLLEEPGKDLVKVTVGKQRDGGTGAVLHLARVPVSISDAENGVMLVLGDEAPNAPIADGVAAFSNEQLILGFLKAAGPEGATRAEICSESGLGKTTAYNILQDLSKSGRIIALGETNKRWRYWHADHAPAFKEVKAGESEAETHIQPELSELPGPFRGRLPAESTRNIEGVDGSDSPHVPAPLPRKKRPGGKKQSPPRRPNRDKSDGGES